MKIFITYAATGAGHFKAAQAIYNYIEEQCPSIEIKIVDILKLSNALFSFFYKRGYAFMIREFFLLWRWLYWITDIKPLRGLTRSVVSVANCLNTKRFAKFLIRENPDFIISTHFLPSEISSNLKITKRIKSRLITVITDFGVHPFWVSDGTDIYIVASEFTKKQLIASGVVEDRVKEFGIPVDSKFLAPFDRPQLCRKFDIAEDKFTALIMTGSFGIGPVEEIVNALQAEIQILVVCATNKKLYSGLKKRHFANVRVFGFVDNAQELMAVSDMIITKPGGLTVSEILNMELVPLFISVIPGQEANNAATLKRYGIGLNPKSIVDIKNIVLNFRDNPNELKSLRDNIKKLKKPNTLREICNVVCQGSLGLTC